MHVNDPLKYNQWYRSNLEHPK